MAAGARAVRKYAVAAAEEEASADQADEVERHARDGSWGTRAASRRSGPSTTDERGDSLRGDLGAHQRTASALSGQQPRR